jgi:hypothetical protein
VNGQIDVTNAEPKFIVSLFEEVESLEAELTRGTNDMEMARHHKERIDEARAALMRGLVFDTVSWSQLSAGQQKHLLDRLTVVRDELLAKKHVGQATQSSYPLESEDSPKHLILWVTIFGFIFVATLLSLIR